MRGLFLLLVLSVLLVLGLFFTVTDAKPIVSRSVQVSMADLDRGKAIVDSLGLRRMQEGEVRQLALPASDLDTGVNYLAHRLAHGSASAQIVLSQLIVRVSLPLPAPGPRRYVNLELAMASGDALLKPEKLRIGKLVVPANMAGDLLIWGLARSAYAAELAAVATMLNSAQISGQTLALRFTWRGAALEKAMNQAVALGVDETTLSAYRKRLSQVGGGEFSVLLGEAFALAQTRSAKNDPIIENRAALTCLAEMTLGGRLLSRRGMVKVDRHTGIKLAGREDFSQHFALSAFLAATGGEGLSEMAGLYKELKDAQGGSGFSFNDLAADRAGSRLGEASTRSRASALKMQKRLAGIGDAQAFFPNVRDLPEYMPQAEFQRRYGGVGQPAYRKMVEQIEARIAGLTLYRK
ncbi:MAG: hypothetical protein B7Y41_08155 [Hydrogenophilales bacterium 28-61-23]|nr:MAG: hypothetical protein B7Y41_08155 [Hydrogenophilales bacterium 28-61-23]